MKLQSKTSEHQDADALTPHPLTNPFGEMAASIAHEINNPLEIIISRIGTILETLHSPNPNLHLVADCASAAQITARRVSRAMQALSILASDGELDQFKQISLLSLFQEAALLCSERFQARKIDLKLHMPDEQIFITLLPAPMTQVILNLLNNAFDAAENLPIKWTELGYKIEREHIEIFVMDSGEPPHPSIRKKLMLPFFTTKPGGTGIGLSISKLIMELHGGTLEFDETSPHTRFTLRLPKANNDQGAYED